MYFSETNEPSTKPQSTQQERQSKPFENTLYLANDGLRTLFGGIIYGMHSREKNFTDTSYGEAALKHIAVGCFELAFIPVVAAVETGMFLFQKTKELILPSVLRGGKRIVKVVRDEAEDKLIRISRKMNGHSPMSQTT